MAAAAAALCAPLLVFWIAAAAHSRELNSILFGDSHSFVRDVFPTFVLPAIALALGAWEITRNGRPRRKDLLVVVLGVVGLSFILMVGYIATVY
jgi:hypothetical protein